MGLGLKILPLTIIPLIVLVSGCTDMIDPETLALAHPVVQDFFNDYPNAEIKMTHFSAAESQQILGEIRTDCDNDLILPMELYRINITDTDSGLYAVVWLDWKEKEVECVWKYTKNNAQPVDDTAVPEQPPAVEGCEPRHELKCYDDDSYWYDSCGNNEGKKEDCALGCEYGFCKSDEDCTSHHGFNCYDDNLYWFDSCGKVEEKKEACDIGCSNSECIAELCVTHNETKCFSGDIFWYDSCGNKEEIKFDCPEGCFNKTCVSANCTDEYEQKCFGNNLYWYDSCGNREEFVLNCDYGCGDGNVTCYDPPPVPVTPIDCGDSLGCLAGASENCNLSYVTYDVVFDMIVFTQTTTSYNEILGMDSGQCEFYLRTEDINLTFLPGTPQETIDEQEALYEPLVGRDGNCLFETSDLTAMLNRWNSGSFSPSDWDVAECIGTFFGS